MLRGKGGGKPDNSNAKAVLVSGTQEFSKNEMTKIKLLYVFCGKTKSGK